MKICRNCNNEFVSNKLGRPQIYCSRKCNESNHNNSHNTAAQSSYVLLRQLIIELYGKRCNNCGWPDQRVLQIDHINGGGKNDRGKSPTRFYKSIYCKPDFDKYQLLCANCNWLKYIAKS